MSKTTLQTIKSTILQVIVGKDEVIDQLLACILSGGHLLLEDLPGTGKTVLARTLAASMDLRFSRIQFTPDLLPSDVTGLNYFDRVQNAFVFREGPVFSNLVLADEINRATPRTQSALLECMGEGQVTVDGVTRSLPNPFLVIATQNPVETLGCFPLPEAQLDRFLMKISMGDFSAAEERFMIDRFITDDPLERVTPVAGAEDILKLRQECRQIFVHSDLRDYIVALIQSSRGKSSGNPAASMSPIAASFAVSATRSAREGVSPRGTLALVRASQAFAMIAGRDYVTPEDIKKAAVPVLAHRLISEAPSWEKKAEHIQDLLYCVPVPTEDWRR